MRSREGNAIAASLTEAMRFFGRARPDGKVMEVPGLTMVYCGLNYAAFNSAVVAPPPEASQWSGVDLRRHAEIAIERFGGMGLRWTYWLCDDFLEPSARLEARGLFQRMGLSALTQPPGMYADCLLPPRHRLPALSVKRVADADTRNAFAHITSVGFEIPASICHDIYGSAGAWHGKFQGFVGYSAGLPVCTVATLESEDAVGIYSVATLPNCRGYGFAESIMRQVLGAARGRTGIEATVLQATECGMSLYHKMGYRKITRFSVYIS